MKNFACQTAKHIGLWSLATVASMAAFAGTQEPSIRSYNDRTPGVFIEGWDG